jgi:hypothetical protein
MSVTPDLLSSELYTCECDLCASHDAFDRKIATGQPETAKASQADVSQDAVKRIAVKL